MMKALTVTALVCALMALTGATALLPGPDEDQTALLPGPDEDQTALLPGPVEDQTENTFLFERSACPDGWTEINGRCFRFVPYARSWAEAERNCLSMGANLASIHSASEYHDVQRVIAAATHDYRVAWVGGSDAQQNGIWLWSDGKKFHYSRWCPGEPNNGGGQACLQMNYSGQKCWDDAHCSRHKSFVCAMTPK